MKGSIIINNSNINYRVVIGINNYLGSLGAIRTIDTYELTDGLYNYPLEIGDIVNVSIASPTGTTEIVNIYRKDFTTDDEGGDMGIKETFITGQTGTSVNLNFTASTRPDAYNFHYLVNSP